MPADSYISYLYLDLAKPAYGLGVRRVTLTRKFEGYNSQPYPDSQPKRVTRGLPARNLLLHKIFTLYLDWMDNLLIHLNLLLLFTTVLVLALFCSITGIPSPCRH